MNPLLTYTITFNQDPLLNRFTAIDKTLETHEAMIKRISEKQSLEEHDYSSIRLAIDNINKNMSKQISSMLETYCERALDEVLKKSTKHIESKLTKQLYDSLNAALKDSLQDHSNSITLLNNSIGKHEDELRKTRFKLDNLANSYQRKVGYFEMRFEEIQAMMPQPRELKEEEMQTMLSNNQVASTQHSFNSHHEGGQGRGLQRKVRHLEQLIVNNQQISSNAYQSVKLRLIQLEKHLKKRQDKDIIITPTMPQGNSPRKVSTLDTDPGDTYSKKITDIEARLKAVVAENEKEHMVFKDEIHKVNLKITQTKKSEEQLYNQEQALYQKVKNMVNTLLANPFDQIFGQSLRQQILFKFAEIRHQLLSILKQVEKKDVHEFDSLRLGAEDKLAETSQILNKKATEETIVPAANTRPRLSTLPDDNTFFINGKPMIRTPSKSWFKNKLPNVNNSSTS